MRNDPKNTIIIPSWADGYYFVYRATNTVNGKVYIGLTNNFEYRRYRHYLDASNGSPLHFHRAIRKYGKEAFDWSIMYMCSSVDAASRSEQMLVEHYDSYRNGYNMTTGGEQGWSKATSEETKRKLSALYLGKTYEEIHGAEKALAIKQKQSQAHQGRKFSQEHKERLSEANRRRWKEGNIGKKGKQCIVHEIQYRNGKEAAEQLGITGPTLRKWIKQGKNGARYV